MEGLLTTSSRDGRDPRVEWLYHQIAQLKEVDRSLALLLDGFSYKEIVSIVGLTESNVGVKVEDRRQDDARFPPTVLDDSSTVRESLPRERSDIYTRRDG